MIIDTHSHIFDEKFDNDIDEVINRSQSAGVSHVLLPNIDVESIDKVNDLADKYSQYCLPMMGLHPTSVTENWEEDLKLIKRQFDARKYIAVGEIGLDLYWDKSLKEQQEAAFEEQLRWSIEYNLPVSIHCREAILESIACIKRVGVDKLKGIFHSFGGSKEELEEVLQLENFLIGINGTLTYKNSSLPEVLKATNLSRIVVETDAPYLPPVPFRGKRNEPSYTTYIIEKLSNIYSIPPSDVERITTENSKKIFSIG